MKIIILILLLSLPCYAFNMEECIEHEMAHWENITEEQAKTLCKYYYLDYLEEEKP